MEVVHRRVEEEEQLLTRRRQDSGDTSGYVSGDGTSSDEMNEEAEMHENGMSPKSGYLDKSQDTKIQWSVSGEKLTAVDELDITKLVTAVINRQSIIGDHFKNEILPESSVKTDEEKESMIVEANENVRMDVVGEEESYEDEEIIELEFERAVEKVHTHTPFCPNCSKQITKVILRRKIPRSPRPRRVDLFGCFSCFNIFIPSDDRAGGHLNPFGFFGSKPEKLESPQLQNERPSTDIGGTITAAGATAGKQSLNPLNCFGYKPKEETVKIEDKQPSTDVGSGTTSKADGTPWIHGKREGDEKEESSEIEREKEEATSEHPTTHVTIDIDARTDTTLVLARGDIHVGVAGQEEPLIPGNQRSKSLEILKCIVHGGLLESIASLSVVSSAAASDATTSNVVTIALATLFSSLIAFFYSLIDLRNDAGSIDKYEQVLGRRGHFLLHSALAIFSFLLFGLVPPTTYGFAFRDTDNRDYKMIAVAAAAFASVFVLAIAKAYVRGADKFGSYVKTLVYYVSMAVSVSGIAYAAGDVIGMGLEKFEWFHSDQGLAPPVPGWASY